MVLARTIIRTGKTTRRVQANKTVRVMRLSWAVKSVKVKLAN